VPSSATVGWPVSEFVAGASIVTVQSGALYPARTPVLTVTPAATGWVVQDRPLPSQPEAVVAARAGDAAEIAIASATGRAYRRMLDTVISVSSTDEPRPVQPPQWTHNCPEAGERMNCCQRRRSAAAVPFVPAIMCGSARGNRPICT
jgi:hypothetical protein